MSEKHRRSLRLLTILYIALMLWLLFFQRQPRCWEMPYIECLRTGMELELFRATKRYLYIARYDLATAIIYLGGNILCFLPMGFFLSLGRKGPGRVFLEALGLILAIELVQYVTTLGYFDIDDIVSNLLGVGLGWLLYRLLRRRKE